MRQKLTASLMNSTAERAQPDDSYAQSQKNMKRHGRGVRER